MGESTFIEWVVEIEQLTGLSYLDLMDWQVDLLGAYKKGKAPQDVVDEMKKPEKKVTKLSFFNVEV